MIKISMIILLGLCLAGCAELKAFQSATTAVETVAVSPELVSVAGNTFDGLEVTAKNYLAYCRINKYPSPACSKVAAGQLVQAIKAGRNARDLLERSPGDQGSYDRLRDVIATVQNIFSIYKIGAQQ